MIPKLWDSSGSLSGFFMLNQFDTQSIFFFCRGFGAEVLRAVAC